MINKNKNLNTQKLETLTGTAAEHLGMFVVGVATVLNVAGLSHLQGEHHAVGTSHSSVAQAHTSEGSNNEMRRPGREEIRHSSASFGAFQRSPITTGTL